jgi:hypothetical protein
VERRLVIKHVAARTPIADESSFERFANCAHLDVPRRTGDVALQIRRENNAHHFVAILSGAQRMLESFRMPWPRE